MSKLSASDLFAISFGGRNEGEDECHWCGSKCRRIWRHDDEPITPFKRTSTFARRPGNAYVCLGCWRFRWRRVTVPFLGGGYKDGQSPEYWSWWVTEQGAWAVRPTDPVDREALYGLLLKPPLRCCLMLLEGAGQVNRLHLGVANDHLGGVQNSTPVEFTVNNILHTYTPYDLEQGLRTGAQGKPPGVQALLRLLGGLELPPAEGARPEKMPAGRPKPLPDGRQLQKQLVMKSGG